TVVAAIGDGDAQVGNRAAEFVQQRHEVTQMANNFKGFNISAGKENRADQRKSACGLLSKTGGAGVSAGTLGRNTIAFQRRRLRQVCHRPKRSKTLNIGYREATAGYSGNDLETGAKSPAEQFPEGKQKRKPGGPTSFFVFNVGTILRLRWRLSLHPRCDGQ